MQLLKGLTASNNGQMTYKCDQQNSLVKSTLG